VALRRIVIDAWYGRSQIRPGRSTGQVGPYTTRPRIPESGRCGAPLAVATASAATAAAVHAVT
jgi:hypothetical protein